MAKKHIYDRIHEEKRLPYSGGMQGYHTLYQILRDIQNDINLYGFENTYRVCEELTHGWDDYPDKMWRTNFDVIVLKLLTYMKKNNIKKIPVEITSAAFSFDNGMKIYQLNTILERYIQNQEDIKKRDTK